LRHLRIDERMILRWIYIGNEMCVCVCGIVLSEEMAKWLPPINMVTDIRVPMQREIS